ncbi:CD48 antigen-like isoform X1 [Phyllopteryx taeniolatus]|uniref:CD48 antigen-like isoform X1 n=1 Tax=Phyllopteryx taeniolatus TaxID=161469 RepID=UPI002AD5097F|nr:CD48 antigen-like isoform X1 [Phyllopteryx taeniolatus]
MAHQRFLVYFACTFSLVSPQVLKYVLRGQEINLVPPRIEKPDGMVWVHDDSNVVEFHIFARELVYPPYQNRITLDHNSAELTIKDATNEDSGNYDLKLKKNDERRRIKFRVEVIDKVTKPNISCEMINANQAILVCSTECKCPHLLKFKWRSQGNEQAGPNLTITLNNEHDDQVYQCNVSNPLTSETSTYTAKDCFLEKTPAAGIFIWDENTTALFVFTVVTAVSFTAVLTVGLTAAVLTAVFMSVKKFQFSECFAKLKEKCSIRNWRD